MPRGEGHGKVMSLTKCAVSVVLSVRPSVTTSLATLAGDMHGSEHSDTLTGPCGHTYLKDG